MFIYTENDPESHRNTQNIKIKPRTHQYHENTFASFQLFLFIYLIENQYFQKIQVRRKKNEGHTT